VNEDQVLGAMLYDLNFGHKVRLVLNRLGVSRALLWLTALRDGSVVVGLSRAASDVLRGEQESGSQREVRVNFADAEPVTDPEVLRKLHATFHPSRAINVGVKRHWQDPWELLSKPRQLCLVAFELPDRYPIVLAPRKRDVVLDYNVLPDQQLVGKMIVSNAGSPVLVQPPGQGLSLVFDVAGVERPGGLRLQLILANQALGQWPQRTLFAWSGRLRTST
jgi:hypothetical protein